MLPTENPAADAPRCRLSINIDHVASLRCVGGVGYPEPVRAAKLAAASGADAVAIQLNKDLPGVTDTEISGLIDDVALPVSVAMELSDELLDTVLSLRPDTVRLASAFQDRNVHGEASVSERAKGITRAISILTDAEVKVSLTVEPDAEQLTAAREVGAPVVQLNTSDYHEAVLSSTPSRIATEHKRVKEAAEFGARIGLEIHAGGGLTFGNVQPVAAIPEIVELTIGHFLISEAIFMGLDQAIREMRRLIDDVRTGMLV